MKISTRVDSIGGEHVHFALFMNGKAGDLVLKIHEYERFRTILEQGALCIERQEVSIEPALNEVEAAALDNIHFCVDTENGIPALPNDEEGREMLLQSLCILYPRLRRLKYENLSNAPQDEPPAGSSQSQDSRPAGKDAQQLQGNWNDQLVSGLGETTKPSTPSGVGEGSGPAQGVSPGSKIPFF